MKKHLFYLLFITSLIFAFIFVVFDNVHLKKDIDRQMISITYYTLLEINTGFKQVTLSANKEGQLDNLYSIVTVNSLYYNSMANLRQTGTNNKIKAYRELVDHLRSQTWVLIHQLEDDVHLSSRQMETIDQLSELLVVLLEDLHTGLDNNLSLKETMDDLDVVTKILRLSFRDI